MRRAVVTCQSRHQDMRMDIEHLFAAQVFGAESQAIVSQQQGHRSSASASPGIRRGFNKLVVRKLSR
jgi:hypothetical protein